MPESVDDKYGRLVTTMMRWLQTRGGRDERDVMLDDQNRPFVFMQNGREGMTEVYIPLDLFNDLSELLEA